MVIKDSDKWYIFAPDGVIPGLIEVKVYLIMSDRLLKLTPSD